MKKCRVAMLCSFLTLALFVTVSCYITILGHTFAYMAMSGEVTMQMSGKSTEGTMLQ